MSTALQRVRQLQEEIRAREEQLKALAETPEYKADASFMQDVADVLEMHGRTLKEAVLLIDPSLLGTAAADKPKRPYKPRKPKDVEHFTLPPEPKAPKASPFASFGQGGDASASPDSSASPDAPDAPAPVVEQPAPAAAPAAAPKPVTKNPKSERGNRKRNAERRIEMIKGGRWFLYTNPHTGEAVEAARQGDDTLRAWAAEYGKVTVESWKRLITPDEVGL